MAFGILCRDQLLNTIEMERLAEEKDNSNKSSIMKMQNTNLIDPRMISPLHLSRLNKKGSKNDKNQQQQSQLYQDDDEEIEMDGFRVPKELNSVWAVSKVLNQTKGKLRLKELIKTSVNNQNITVQHKVMILVLPKLYEIEIMIYLNF
jgi:hypothetical protein